LLTPSSPDELSGDPLEFVRVVGRSAAAAGAEIRTHTEVLSLHAERKRIARVETTSGPLRAETVVLAVGAWTPRLAHGLGFSLPVEGGKRYHVDHEPAAGDPHVPLFLQEARVIATSMPGRLRLSGTLDLAGFDLSIDRRRLAAIERAGRRCVRALDGRRVVQVRPSSSSVGSRISPSMCTEASLTPPIPMFVPKATWIVPTAFSSSRIFSVIVAARFVPMPSSAT
jgi:glycine/D-amino acid oxidase-like deaminating enzyme